MLRNLRSAASLKHLNVTNHSQPTIFSTEISQRTRQMGIKAKTWSKAGPSRNKCRPWGWMSPDIFISQIESTDHESRQTHLKKKEHNKMKSKEKKWLTFMRVSFLKEPNQHSIFALQDLSPTTPSLFPNEKEAEDKHKGATTRRKNNPSPGDIPSWQQIILDEKTLPFASWWFFLPSQLNICSSKWIPFPQGCRGESKKGLWNHHLRA